VSGIRQERQGALAVLRLDKARGNAIDEELVEELRAAGTELQADDGVRGVLLASAHPKLFCPGLDLVSLADYDRARLERFMGGFARMLQALYGLRKPMVAAVSGHAVAGGCILALTADWRVLRRGASIGLNEVKVGVPLPLSVTALLRATVGPGALSRVALLGRNFADEEALAAGLADELAGGEDFESACVARLQEFVEKDLYSLGVTKGYLRAETLSQMKAEDAAASAEWLDGWFSPGTQQRIRATVASLTRKTN
jgi:enoyl-CoA hydratase/carnithine racemase